MVTTVSEMKSTLDGINGRLNIADNKTSEFYNIEVEDIQNETQMEKK